MSEIIMRVQMDEEKVAAMDEARKNLHEAVRSLDVATSVFENSLRKLEFTAKRVDDPEKLTDDFATFYNDQTMFKVAEGLRAAHLNEEQITDAINQMQNRGIFFRERA